MCLLSIVGVQIPEDYKFLGLCVSGVISATRVNTHTDKMST